MGAKKGDHVKVHFTGKMDDGIVFGSSHGHAPLEFNVGDGSVLPGVDKAVDGMAPGEKKTVTLAPTDGFGEANESLILVVDRSQFPPGFDIREGMELQFPQPDGGVVFIKVLQILENGQIKLDTNHPLAGKSLVFELELLEIA